MQTLTGLRFAAALVVFVAHSGRILDADRRDQLHWLIGGGHVGVGFFFMLSGFVLMWTLRPGDSPAAFYRRRFARVYPSHVAVWVIALALIALPGYYLSSRRGAVLGLFLLHGWVPDQSYYYAVNGVAWSLSVEVFFYATFPLYARRLLRAGVALRRGLAVAAALMVFLIAAIASSRIPTEQLTNEQPAGTWMWVVYNFPLVRVAEFVIGAVLAIEVRNGLCLPRWTYPVGLTLAAAAAVLSGAIPSSFGLVAWSLLPFVVLIAAAASRDVQRQPTTLSRPMWVRLGEWSFAFYLVHQVISHGVQYNVEPMSSAWLWLLVSIALLLASMAASAALYMWVEAPAERRLRISRGSEPRPEKPGGVR